MEQCFENKTIDEALRFQYSMISWILILIFIPLVIAFGICSNFAFIYVVYRIEAMRTITNIFLVNLAIADSSLLIVAFAKYIASYVNSPVYDFGFSFDNAYGCITSNFLMYLCYYASLWTVTLVSVERYLGICHSLWHMSIRSTRRTVYLVLASWLVSALFASPIIPHAIRVKQNCVISLDTHEILERIPVCVWECESCKIVLYSTDLIQFLAALIVNIVLYSLIVRQLTKTAILNEGMELRSNNVKEGGHSRRRNTVARMLVVHCIVFFTCLMPFSVNNVDNLAYYFGWFKTSDIMETTVAWIARVLFLLNSTLNSLIYNATNPRYRSAFKEAFLSEGF